ELDDAHRRWVIEGGDDWTGKWNTQWYGVRRFFDWLESRAYKMHIRVLLSRYRSYNACGTCGGARLVPDALLWRLDSRDGEPARSGPTIHDLMLMPIERVAGFFTRLRLPSPLDEA